MRFMKIISIVITIVLLTGCTTSESLMSGASRKYESKDGASNVQQQCHQWCHNGWCSTHCDPVVSGS